MPGWYDIRNMSDEAIQDDQIQSAQYLSQLVETYNASVIGGFSQGGAVSIFTAFNICQLPLKGVIALSAYAFNFQKLRDLPYFIYHGAADPLITMGRAKQSYARALGITEI